MLVVVLMLVVLVVVAVLVVMMISLAVVEVLRQVIPRFRCLEYQLCQPLLH